MSACILALLLCSVPLNSVNIYEAAKDQKVQPIDEVFEITVIPPRIIQYPVSDSDMDHFSLSIKSDKPLDKVQIRLLFSGDFETGAEFFTGNILWKKIDQAYYLTSIYGKPAEIPVVEKYFKLEVSYRFRPHRYTAARIEILNNSKVIKSVPVDFIAPIKFSDIRDRFFKEIREDINQKIAAGIVCLVLFWFFYDFFYRRQKRKNIPLCTTRARFSTLLEENNFIKIGETVNPFGCRLDGLRKKIKIQYTEPVITVWISGKRFTYDDRDGISIDINELWKIRIEAQNYFGNDEKSHKNLVILLLPV